MTMAKTKSRFANRCIIAFPGRSKGPLTQSYISVASRRKGRRHFLQRMSPEVAHRRRFLPMPNESGC